MKEEIVFMKSEMKRKGFTLVELLIVIVVIGI
ncbi:MAG: prepilin-type N-terminal cleavage/methylation domain-containing protein, partial [Synergistaceae bacterium]|nr:prepilin-type N-terminal cleavage/methylation domain-containing protein [Synergistaceae bacterium]